MSSYRTRLPSSVLCQAAWGAVLRGPPGRLLCDAGWAGWGLSALWAMGRPLWKGGPLSWKSPGCPRPLSAQPASGPVSPQSLEMSLGNPAPLKPRAEMCAPAAQRFVEHVEGVWAGQLLASAAASRSPPSCRNETEPCWARESSSPQFLGPAQCRDPGAVIRPASPQRTQRWLNQVSSSGAECPWRCGQEGAPSKLGQRPAGVLEAPSGL